MDCHLWKLRKLHTKRHYVDGNIRLKSNANGNVKLPSAGLMKTSRKLLWYDKDYYAAIIVENTPPMLEAIVGDFKQTAESLTGEKL